MEQQYGENNNNYSILCNNLKVTPNKYKSLNRMFSPVLIQSYGSNNFVVELKYKTKNSKNTDDYDYIENELKSTKKSKAYTTYTEISNEESLFFNAQNQPSNPRYFRDFTNYNVFYPDNIYNTNNYFYDKNNNHIFKKEDTYTLFYPSEKIYIPKKNINKINHNNLKDLKYQRFCASFISKNSNSNRNSPQKAIYKKKETCLNNKLQTEKKERQVSKSKNQLEDFNIDKLKEIGDNLAMRYMNRVNTRKRLNMYRKQNQNIVNNLAVVSDKKEKHEGIISKIIMIEQKRKESKNKMNLINKTEDNKSRSNKNDIFDNSNNYEIRTLNDTCNNNLSNRNKILKVNKNRNDIKHSPSPMNKKIKVSNFIRRKKYTLNGNMNNSSNNLEINNSNIKSIRDIKDIQNTSNIEKKDIYKTNINHNKINRHINNKTYVNINKNQINHSNNKINNDINSNVYRHINNKTYTEIKIDKNIPKFRNKERISVNRRLNMGRSKDKANVKTKSINHNYLESINIKNNKKTKKVEHFFNNMVMPLQKI